MLRALEASGLLRPHHLADGDRYSDADVRFVRNVLTLLGVGLSLDDLMRIARQQLETSDALGRDVMDAWSAAGRAPASAAPGPGADGPEHAARVAASIRALAAIVGQLVAYRVERAVLDAAHAEIEADGTTAELEALARSLGSTARQLTVGRRRTRRATLDAWPTPTGLDRRRCDVGGQTTLCDHRARDRARRRAHVRPRPPRRRSSTRPRPTVPLDDPASGCTIWLKLEYQLPSGSTKDRLAAHVLRRAVDAGRVHAGTTVVEASSGSTSIAFAMACAALGVRFLAVLPEGVSNERLHDHPPLRRRGGAGPRRGRACRAPSPRPSAWAAADPDVFLPRQFTNPENAVAHELRTGPELRGRRSGRGRPARRVRRRRRHRRHADGRRAGGAAGQPRRPRWPGCVVAGEAVDAEQGGPACLGIPGVVDCLSGLLDEDELGGHPPLAVPRTEAMAAARELAAPRVPGRPVERAQPGGRPPAGAAAGPGHHVATVCCDRMERYFSTDLFDDLRDG